MVERLFFYAIPLYILAIFLSIFWTSWAADAESEEESIQPDVTIKQPRWSLGMAMGPVFIGYGCDGSIDFEMFGFKLEIPSNFLDELHLFMYFSLIYIRVYNAVFGPTYYVSYVVCLSFLCAVIQALWHLGGWNGGPVERIIRCRGADRRQSVHTDTYVGDCTPVGERAPVKSQSTVLWHSFRRSINTIHVMNPFVPATCARHRLQR